MKSFPHSADRISYLGSVVLASLLLLTTGCGFSTGKSSSSQLGFTASSLPSGVAGIAYSQTVPVAGGVAPYSFAVATGTLPTGLSLAPTGMISGTPATNQQTTVTIQVADSQTPHQSVSQSFVMKISPDPSVTTAVLPNGIVSTSYSASLTASGGTAPYTWSVSSGTLPAGLKLSAAGALSGVPTAVGSATFTVTVQDSSVAESQRQQGAHADHCGYRTSGFGHDFFGSGCHQGLGVLIDVDRDGRRTPIFLECEFRLVAGRAEPERYGNHFRYADSHGLVDVCGQGGGFVLSEIKCDPIVHHYGFN